MRIAFNSNNPLGRHTGTGRYPAIENAPQSGQNQGVVPLTWGICSHLDTGVRRYDAVFSNGLFGFNYQILGGRMLGWKAEKFTPDAVRFMIGVERGKIPAQSR